MKEYVLSLKLRNGNDEFWESIADKTGCDEVLEMVKGILIDAGFDFDNSECSIDLVSYHKYEAH